MTLAARHSGRRRRWLQWLWPLGLLLIAWLIAPVRAGAAYPGMPCTAQADTVFGLASYTILFIPTAVILLVLSRRLIPAAVRRGLRAWVAGLSAVCLGVALVFLAFVASLILAMSFPRRLISDALPAPSTSTMSASPRSWAKLSKTNGNKAGFIAWYAAALALA